MAKASIALSALLSTAAGQQIGWSTPEVHPRVNISKCTKAGGCIVEEKSLVGDSNWRWMHSTDNTGEWWTKLCKQPDGSWNPTYCPTPEACGQNCVLEGIDYTGQGYKPTDNGFTLQWPAAPRMYLLNDPYNYKMLRLKNREFAFDVDMSQLPCGLNGAVYLVEMQRNGGASEKYPAGAEYGTGYCDAQCPHPSFIDGRANLEDYPPGKYGYCCAEMDILEGNSAAGSFTPHPCSIKGQYACDNQTTCGDMSADPPEFGVCDKYGCGFNPYYLGDRGFWGRGPDFAVDTSRPFTVVIQFLTTDGTDEGDLKEIRRLFVQDGQVIANSKAEFVPPGTDNSLTDAFCAKEHVAPDAEEEVPVRVGRFGSSGPAQPGQATREAALKAQSAPSCRQQQAKAARAASGQETALAQMTAEMASAPTAAKPSPKMSLEQHGGQASGPHDAFLALGGMKAMGGALERGMVLTFSLWNDDAGRMLWLDGIKTQADQDPSVPFVSNGPCPYEWGTTADLQAWAAENGTIEVTYTNIKYGEIDSTYPAPGCKSKRSYCEEFCSEGLGYQGAKQAKCTRACVRSWYSVSCWSPLGRYCKHGVCATRDLEVQAEEASLLQRAVRGDAVSLEQHLCVTPSEVCADLCKDFGSMKLGCKWDCNSRFTEHVQPILDHACEYGLCDSGSSPGLAAEGQQVVEEEASLIQWPGVESAAAGNGEL